MHVRRRCGVALEPSFVETAWFVEDSNRMERLRKAESDEADGRVTEFTSVAALREAATKSCVS